MNEVNAYQIYLKLKKRDILLLDVEPIDEKTAYVLCIWKNEYVIWTMNLENFDTQWGYYYNDMDSVMEKYAELIY